jgi:hypothetical protein
MTLKALLPCPLIGRTVVGPQQPGGFPEEVSDGGSQFAYCKPLPPWVQEIMCDLEKPGQGCEKHLKTAEHFTLNINSAVQQFALPMFLPTEPGELFPAGTREQRLPGSWWRA